MVRYAIDRQHLACMNNDSRRITTISKYLSKHLRHEPEKLGLTLQSGGWVPIADLLAASARSGFAISIEELHTVVTTSDKQRFAIDDTGKLIRANQGHSVEVDLQLEVATPPDLLYHGTYRDAVAPILATGLQKMSRHHVHLSADRQTAERVGSRRGQSYIFNIDAAAMVADGFQFYRSANHVWLVDAVPPQYLSGE
jgi:putative RNA 2'-phosphotransferase